MLGLTTLKVALHKAKGTPLPDGLAGFDELELRSGGGGGRTGGRVSAGLDEACHRGPGVYVGVYNCGGELYAIEDRCSHDDGPLCEGDWDEETCTVVCPRHGSAFELSSGRPRSLPAFQPVETYPVKIVDGVVRLELPLT